MRVEKEGENKSLKSHGSRGRSPSITGRGKGLAGLGWQFSAAHGERPPRQNDTDPFWSQLWILKD